MKAVAALLVLALSGVASAQPSEPPPPPGPMAPPPPEPVPPPAQSTVVEQPKPAKVHDGLFIRGFLGVAWTGYDADSQGQELNGTGPGLGVQFGGAVTKNLILFVELWGQSAARPRQRVYGEPIFVPEDTTVALGGFGAGIAYYKMPINIYFQGSIVSTALNFSSDGVETLSTEDGVGLSLMVGKEWMVSREVGLGVGAQLFFGKYNEETPGADVEWSAASFAILGTVTYN